MITPQQHLENLLKKSAIYSLSQDEKNQLSKLGVESFIFAKLSSKKFRKKKMSDECVAHTMKAIEIAVRHNKPLQFVFPQGGYKLWRMPSSPQADWAEFFNISYILQYIAAIAAAYKPGVEITYYLFDRLMEFHDNLTKSEIQAYQNSFQELLKSFAAYTPKNMKLSIVTESDLYPGDLYDDAISNDLSRAEVSFDAFSNERKQAWEKSARLNIKLDGKEDWTKLTEEEMNQKIRFACIYEEAAAYCLKKVWAELITDEVVLIFVKQIAFSIAIGSTRTSTAKHWVGFGVLEEDNKGYYERILTPSQFNTLKDKPHKVVPIQLLKGKNFSEIQIFPRQKFQ